VTYLSVIVPLVALILLLCLVLWLGYVWMRGYRTRVSRETGDAYTVVGEEFTALREELVKEIGALEKANQSRELTREEMRIFHDLSRRLDLIERHIAAEIEDIVPVAKGVRAARAVQHQTIGKYQQPGVDKTPQSPPPYDSDPHTVHLRPRRQV
jgi:hypothetical protein